MVARRTNLLAPLSYFEYAAYFMGSLAYRGTSRAPMAASMGRRSIPCRLARAIERATAFPHRFST